MRNRILTVLGVALLVGILLYAVGLRSTKLHISVVAEPVICLGGERESLEACKSGFPITNALITTVVVHVLVLLTIFFGVRNLNMIPRGFQNLVEVVVEAFYNFAKSVDAKNVAKFLPFCSAAFIFFLYSNVFGLFPGVGSIGVCAPAGHKEASAYVVPVGGNADVALAAGGEEGKAAAPDFFASWPLSCPKETTLVPVFRAPTADLNFTIAWGLASVVLIQIFGVQALGSSYFTKFFNFKEGPMIAFVGLLELISEFVRIVAFSFRLFGNIFAGEVLLVVMAFLFAYMLPVPFYLFELFVAFMQAFIFAVLSLVFMSLATQAHGGHDDHGHAAAH